MAVYGRFTARGGNFTMIYSDNGTTFRGTSNDLAVCFLFHEISSVIDEFAAYVAQDGTEWVFIPPLGPHFGGLC